MARGATLVAASRWSCSLDPNEGARIVVSGNTADAASVAGAKRKRTPRPDPQPQPKPQLQPHTVYTIESESLSALKPQEGFEFTAYVLDVVRKDMAYTDFHANDVHANLVWFHAPTQTMTRFDSYYASTVAETVSMQTLLDDRLERVCLPHGWTMVRMGYQDVPFGPQMLDSTPAALRKSQGCVNNGDCEFCMAWCCGFLRQMLTRVEVSDVAAFFRPQAVLRRWLQADLALSVPLTLPDARIHAEAYFLTMRALLQRHSHVGERLHGFDDEPSEILRLEGGKGAH